MLRRFVGLFLVSLAITFLVGLAMGSGWREPEATPVAAAQPTAATPSPAAQARPGISGGLPDLTDVAQRAVGSVTNISSTQIVRTPNSPFANDPFFRYFFGDRQDEAFGYRDQRAQSLGSGVIVSADGYVLTNNHVVGNERAEVTVVLGDKRELRAKIVGVDDATDIALLKIPATNLPTLPWGDSSKLRVAEWVLAIGNPFQLNQTVTLGIVSATGRRLEGRVAQYEDFIQTDAAINPGNSGGALVNARGELVGINTAIYSESGGYQGIGFAVPSNLARHVMDDLIKFGEVQRGTISDIVVQPLTSYYAEQLGAPDTKGALVVRMDQRSAAYRAGMRPGDIVVSFNGTKLDDASQFMRMQADAKIGSTVSIGLLREGKPFSIQVPIEKSTRRRLR